ncbi:MAG: acyl-phosphate glycerol 3-phosphate acyltransferase [Hydrogenothermus sp.]|nr:MAG: acyl-phosphate glycerol 3-phosphate acyltransferase [Hydrogenothermus sp.]
MDWQFIGYIAFTYLLASIPFGYVVGKLFGKDITKEGSGNIGATNVTRTIGKKAGILVLILDLLKGFIPVYYAKYLFFDTKHIAIVALTAVVGHCFSIFMKFKGGKGVATGFGVLIAVSGKVALITFLVWLGTFLVSGYVSLASIISASLSWVMIFYLVGDLYLTKAVLLSSILIVFKHSSNIERLLKGTESRFLYKD